MKLRHFCLGMAILFTLLTMLCVTMALFTYMEFLELAPYTFFLAIAYAFLYGFVRGADIRNENSKLCKD